MIIKFCVVEWEFSALSSELGLGLHITASIHIIVWFGRISQIFFSPLFLKDFPRDFAPGIFGAACGDCIFSGARSCIHTIVCIGHTTVVCVWEWFVGVWEWSVGVWEWSVGVPMRPHAPPCAPMRPHARV